jgi:hypothetical protein
MNRGNFRARRELRARRDSHDLATFVKTARRANPMRNVWFGTLRALAQLRKFKNAVVSAAHFLPACGWFTLWDTHKL